jgi:hypothetical protein
MISTFFIHPSVFAGNTDPKTFQEAKASPDWPNWWGATSTEFEAMHEYKFGQSLDAQKYLLIVK